MSDDLQNDRDENSDALKKFKMASETARQNGEDISRLIDEFLKQNKTYKKTSDPNEVVLKPNAITRFGEFLKQKEAIRNNKQDALNAPIKDHHLKRPNRTDGLLKGIVDPPKEPEFVAPASEPKITEPIETKEDEPDFVFGENALPNDIDAESFEYNESEAANENEHQSNAVTERIATNTDKGNYQEYKYNNYGFDPPDNIPPVEPPVTQGEPPELPENNFWKYAGISRDEFNKLIEFRANHEARSRIKMFMLGVLLMPVTLIGALGGYVRGYNRFYREKKFLPNFYPLYPIYRVAISIGIALAWLAAVIAIISILNIQRAGNFYLGLLVAYLISNTLISSIVYGVFKVWRGGVYAVINEGQKFGSARFAREDELYTLRTEKGYYIGQNHLFNDRGHILTVAGTRGGKGTNLIIPNLLGAGGMETSWVVIDPKCENAAITVEYQRAIGQDVVLLNPWGMFTELIGPSQSFNPLDMLPGISDPNLVDDVQMISEMIVPIKADENNSFFTDSARIIISGLLMHLVTSEEGDNKTLKTLWQWVRRVDDEWQDLLAEMGLNETPVNGQIVQNARREILKMSEAGGETFGSIMSDVLLNTDFLKSPPLQESLKSGFKPKDLSNGKTTVYIIIPADKLKSHGRWLRLMTTSLMRAVIRNSNKRVTFLLDEFAALGYLPEIETALSTYAGYNLTVWPILQSLVQLKNLYHSNWQSFIANCTVRHYFSVNDNETAEYVSEAIGHTSNVLVSKSWFGVRKAEANHRLLITPDELRRESGKKIFMFISDLPAIYFPKLPYQDVPFLNDRAGENPYFTVN